MVTYAHAHLTQIVLISLACCMCGRNALCPPTWSANGTSCYATFPDDPVVFPKARVYCNGLNSSLLTIESQEENAFITAELARVERNYAWLDCNSTTLGDIWACHKERSGSHLYGNWKRGYPYRPYGECGAIYKLSTWWNRPCNATDSRPITICKMPTQQPVLYESRIPVKCFGLNQDGRLQLPKY